MRGGRNVNTVMGCSVGHLGSSFLQMNVLALLFSVSTTVTSVGWWWCSRACPTLSCESAVDQNLVSVLRSQLERCGPPELGARPCPPCQHLPLDNLEVRRSFADKAQEWLLVGTTFFGFGVVSTYAFGQFGDQVIRVGGLTVPALTDANRYVPSSAGTTRRV